METYIGFDPGGDDRFGWAVCSPKGHILHVLATGRAAHAKEATTRALSEASNKGMVVAAGIDAPLFWTAGGGRNVDNLVRCAIRSLGAPFPGGTVQHINALRGACLVQGILTANLLHKQFPNIAITESHPKALLYLLGIANRQRDAASVSMVDLSSYIVCEANCVGQHERDAVLGAFTAFAQKERRKGWINLFEREGKPVIPFDYPVAYWMPWDLVEKHKAT